MKKEETSESYKEIDAVILWVDGNDPIHLAKRRKYSSGTDMETHDDIAGATRFADNGEIKWCVRSIERFAPWIRKIYIVTDGQDPQIKTERIPLEIIDHKVIFRGFEQYLPTFNSLAIETMIWRIPGLSNHFIYFNDDLSLLSMTRPGDFFTPDGRPIIYGRQRSALRGRLSLTLDRLTHLNHPKVKYRYLMLNAGQLLHRKKYFLLEHTPHNFVRDKLREYYLKNPLAIIRNISHRFRNIRQYSPIELQYLLADAELKAPLPMLTYLEPKRPQLVVLPTAKFFCVNSLDQFPKAERQAVIDFLNSKLS